MKCIRLFCNFFIILYLSGCMRNNDYKHIKELAQQITIHRVNHYDMDNDLDNIIYDFDKDDMGFDETEIDLLLEYQGNTMDEDPNFRITKKEGIEDIESLFKIMRYSYAPYQFFGGDEVFNKSKNAIIDRILKIKDNTVKVKDIADIIIEELGYIKDGHFSINEQIFLEPQHYFYNNQLEFILDTDNEYYTYIDNERYYINTINDDHTLNQYLKLSINEDGELVYYLGNIQLMDENIYLNIHLLNKKDNSEIFRNIKLEKANYMEINETQIFNQIIVDNIPIITMRKMIANDEDKIKEFVQTAEIIKQYPISIIDIRGNTGGQDLLGIEWFNNFTGKQPEKICTTFTLYSIVNNYIANKFLENLNMDIELENELLIQMIENEKEKAQSNINQWEIDYGSNTKVQNDNIIFVLFDKLTASSGEVFVEFLYNLENVIFVGTNTGGVLRGNSFINGQLYNSKIVFGFGNMLSIYDSEVFTEGVGFSPDIWIGENDALEKVLLLIEKNHQE